MSRPLTELFPVGPETRLDPQFLNGLIREIEARVSELQLLKRGLEAAISGAQDIALARVNDIIGPAQTDLAERLAQADEALSASQALLETLSGELFDIDQIAGLPAALNGKATAAQGANADAAMPKAGGAFTGTVKAKGFTETVVPLAGTAAVIDFALGSRFTLTTGGNTAFTVSNAVAGCGALIEVTAGGEHTLDWTGIANLKHPDGGTVPAAPASGQTNSYVIRSDDGVNVILTLVEENISA